MRHTVRLLLVAAGSALLTLTVPALAANACDPLYTAGINAVQTPHHVYTSATAGRTGKARSGEAIIAAGAEYVRVHGQWRRSPTRQSIMVEAAREKLKTHPDTCSRVGDQTVDGQAVITYEVHVNEQGTDSLVHILKSTGLLLGQTITRPDGSVVKTRYEYRNVEPPASVQ